MSQRSYSSKVKLGNWFEDRISEEDGYLERNKKEKLVSQKLDFFKQNILRPVNLTVTNDGLLHFGDVVMLVNTGGKNRECSAVSINADVNSLTEFPEPGIKAPCGISAGRSIQACTRTAFIITSVDGSPEGSTLHFEQSFALKTSGFARGLSLTSDVQSFHKVLFIVSWAQYFQNKEADFINQARELLTHALDRAHDGEPCARIEHFDPQERPENEGQPAPANVKVLIKHCKTNQALAALDDHVLWTTYGREYEVTAHTFLNARKAEKDNNHWILCTSDPAGRVFLSHPQSAANNKELTQANPGI